MIFQVIPLRFEFRAIDTVFFPRGKAANIFRGAFGEIFRRIACDPACGDAKSCAKAAQCPYARMFEPRALTAADGPGGFADRPRPFVLRAASLNGRRFEAGEPFALEVNTFDPESAALEYFRQAFEQLGEEGLGPGRPRVALTAAKELPAVKIRLAAQPEPVTRLVVEFLTPTELKGESKSPHAPAFETLFKRARDRVSGLITFYQPQPAAELPDFRALGEQAAAIRQTAGRIVRHEYFRLSQRTGQTHGLGGFTGSATYEGDLAEFLPYLKAAEWSGVGRLTVWGNGMLRVTERRG